MEQFCFPDISPMAQNVEDPMQPFGLDVSESRGDPFALFEGRDQEMLFAHKSQMRELPKFYFPPVEKVPYSARTMPLFGEEQAQSGREMASGVGKAQQFPSLSQIAGTGNCDIYEKAAHVESGNALDGTKDQTYAGNNFNVDNIFDEFGDIQEKETSHARKSSIEPMSEGSQNEIDKLSSKNCCLSDSLGDCVSENKVEQKVPETRVVEHQTAIKEPKDLSKRSDVVNKTILRSMKRYYYNRFNEFSGFGKLSNKEKFSQFHKLVSDFVKTEIVSLNGLTEEQMEETVFFFGSMLSYTHMRRGITNSKRRTQVNFVHKCLYNYSHKKLAQLMSYIGFEFVLRDFVRFGGIDMVIENEETLSKNSGHYKQAAEDLFLRTQE